MEHKVLFSELAALVGKDYELNRYRSAVDIELRHRLHIPPFFGKMRASRITESDIDDSILIRRDEQASNAIINRERVPIKRGLFPRDSEQDCFRSAAYFHAGRGQCEAGFF